MISKRTQENIMAFLFLFFFVWMLVMSFDYTPKARFVPVPIVSVSIVILLIQMYLMNFRKDINLTVDAAELLTGGKSSEAMDKVNSDEEVIKPIKSKEGNEVGALLMTFIYLALILLVGVLIGTFVYILGFFIIVSKLSWKKSLIYTVLTQAFVYIFFVTLLEIQLYQGYIFKLLDL